MLGRATSSKQEPDPSTAKPCDSRHFWSTNVPTPKPKTHTLQSRLPDREGNIVTLDTCCKFKFFFLRANITLRFSVPDSRFCNVQRPLDSSKSTPCEPGAIRCIFCRTRSYCSPGALNPMQASYQPQILNRRHRTLTNPKP